MSGAFKTFLICFGIVFFTGHVAWASFAIRFLSKQGALRDQKLEQAGILVPGLVGLLMVIMPFIPSAWIIVCSIISLLDLIIGRAVFELIVFRHQHNHPPPP